MTMLHVSIDFLASFGLFNLVGCSFFLYWSFGCCELKYNKFDGVLHNPVCRLLLLVFDIFVSLNFDVYHYSLCLSLSLSLSRFCVACQLLKWSVFVFWLHTVAVQCCYHTLTLPRCYVLPPTHLELSVFAIALYGFFLIALRACEMRCCLFYICLFDGYAAYQRHWYANIIADAVVRRSYLWVHSFVLN